MTYKAKSLVYFLGLMITIALYYITDNEATLEQRTQMEVVENDRGPESSDLDFN